MASSRCNICGADAAFQCSRCQKVAYCSQGHQKQDWGTHKYGCFPDPAATCARCLLPVSSSRGVCQVPHPSHLTEILQSMFGPGQTSYDIRCNACDHSFQRSSALRDAGLSDMPITSGPRFCFEGAHCLSLRHTDKRRVYDDVVVLNYSDRLQQDIDELDGNRVRVLKISSNGMYEDGGARSLTLNRSLPELVELQFYDVAFHEIVLTPTTTPKLETLSFQNIGDDCRFQVELPELKKFSMQYYGPVDDESWIENMMDAATKLEHFDSYKFRVSYLCFTSNSLRYVRLHRAELLSELEMWAPRLTTLDLQACYDLEYIEFLEDHPLKQELPAGFTFPEALFVNTMNACLGSEAIAALQAHPRVHDLQVDDGDDFVF